MGVIKSNQAEAVSSRFGAVNLLDWREEGQAIVAAARREAARLISEAKREVAELAARTEKAWEAAAGNIDAARRQAREKGFGEGHDEGYALGLEQGRKEAFTAASEELKDRLRGLGAVLERLQTEMEADRRRLLCDAESDVLSLAVKLAEKVAKRLGEFDRQTAAVNLAKALAMLHDRRQITVRLHPDDMRTIADFAPELQKSSGESSEMQLVADSSVSAGGAIVESGRCVIDATLETQLNNLAGLVVPLAPAPE